MSIIGVEWNQGTDTWSRIDVDGNGIGAPTFDSESPWGDIVRCTLNADGSENEVSANGKGNDISLDGSTGRVMVRIPKFWIKSDSPGANRYRWWISDAAYAGFVVHPVFYQRGNTAAPADYIYVGAYEAGDDGSNKLESQTGDVVTVSQTIGTFRTWAENIGSVRWGITSMWALSAIKLLYYIEYADANSQTTIGKGITGAVGKSATGDDGIDANLATNGTGTGTGVDDETPIAYRGIENLWGNTWQFIDGYEAVDAEYRIIKRDGSGTFRNPLQAGDYEASAAAPILTNGFIKNIVWEDLLSLQFIGSDNTGTNASYLYDRFYAHDTGEVNILMIAGHWVVGAEAGIAYLGSDREAGYLISNVGGRLEFIPEALPVPVADGDLIGIRIIRSGVMANGGDMTKAVYDINEDDVVDNSEKLEASTKAQVQDHTPKAHTLDSHSTKAHSELSDAPEGAHHTKFTTTEHSSIGNGAPHHSKYTDANARTAAVSDTIYGGGWNGVTTIAPSKNAVYDKIQTLGGAALYRVDTEVYAANSPNPGAQWSDLDISAVVGSNLAWVFFRCKNPAGNRSFSFRPNGETEFSYNGAAEAGVTIAETFGTSDRCCITLCPTDASGVVEWSHPQPSEPVTIDVIAYLK